ncbi:MAG: tetratricopeptide repeat protein [Spirochaetes bacterium]|nr:tetratricopeptide repeat protein [Spirochaetota bacterium]
MKPFPKRRIVFLAILIALQAFTGLRSASVRDMDRDAQVYFDNKQYNQAIGLWLSCLEIEPDNERIQQKIELVYEIKQRKDLAYQKARLNYRIARRKLAKEDDKELELGISTGKNAIKDYVTAYRLDPKDSDMRDAKDDMRRLEEDIRTAEEKLRLSRAMRERVEALKEQARTEMASTAPDFEKALELWNRVLRYVPQDVEAIEGKRKCDLAIENRIRYERIRGAMARGIDFFERKDYASARAEFQQVLADDRKHRDAMSYLERIDEILEERQMYTQRQQQAEASYRSGIVNVNNNRFDEARQDFETSLALVRDYRDARQRIADLDRLKKEYDARQRALRLERINRKFQEGIVAYTRGRYRDAIDALVATLNLDRNNRQAEEYLKRARDALRIEEEEEVDRNSPYYDIVNSFIVSGRSLFQRGEYAESKKKWDSILKLFPHNKIAREYIIKCDMMMNPGEKDRVVAMRIMEGRERMEKKDFRNALRIFNTIKSIDRNYPEIDTLIARANAGLREAGTADLAPGDRDEIERRFRAGMNLYQRGGRDNIQQALGHFRWVAQKDPGNVRAVVTVNKIESELRIGAPQAERRDTLTPRQRELVNRYYYNGINHYTNNNFQKAIEEWRKVLTIDPGNVKARNNIRKVLAFMER